MEKKEKGRDNSLLLNRKRFKRENRSSGSERDIFAAIVLHAWFRLNPIMEYRHARPPFAINPSRYIFERKKKKKEERKKNKKENSLLLFLTRTRSALLSSYVALCHPPPPPYTDISDI